MKCLRDAPLVLPSCSSDNWHFECVFQIVLHDGCVCVDWKRWQLCVFQSKPVKDVSKNIAKYRMHRLSNKRIKYRTNYLNSISHNALNIFEKSLFLLGINFEYQLWYHHNKNGFFWVSSQFTRNQTIRKTL